MLACNRWWGDGATFLTTAPISWKQALFYRLAFPCLSNSDIRGSNIDQIIPNTNSKRKALKINSPGADVIIFLRSTTSIFNDLVNIDMPANLGANYGKKAPVSHTQRERGILGAVSALYNANETSLDGNLHTHTKIYGPMSWKYIEEFSANPDLNKLFGTYLNSIIVNELTDINSWSKESIVQFPDPCPIHTKTSDIPMPTSATLPRGGVTIIGADTEPHSMNVDTDPSRTTLPEDETVESSFWTEFEGVAILVQNHGNHNFSCWKNGSVLCRFRLPSHAWNQVSGVIEIELFRSPNKSVPNDFRIKSNVSDKCHQPISRWSQDQRCLIVNTTKRTADNSIIRDPTNTDTYNNLLLQQIPTTKTSAETTELEIKVEWNPNLDQQSKNGYFSPCNAIILVVCGGGFGLHNNIQHVGKGGLGENSYIAKYMTKGIGTLTKSLPLLYEALQNLRQSVHPDALQQVHRPAMTALQQSLNNGTKRKEFSNTLMLASLFGMQQFNSSHKFISINLNFARKEF